jgi:hypothetical protein
MIGFICKSSFAYALLPFAQEEHHSLRQSCSTGVGEVRNLLGFYAPSPLFHHHHHPVTFISQFKLDTKFYIYSSIL